MKCEYCNQDIPAGSGVESNGHFFCNELHRYYWEQKSIGNTSFDFNNAQSGTSSNAMQVPGANGGFMFDKNHPMTLGDIFSSGFNLIKNTFTRNLVVLAVFIIPAGILLSIGIRSYFYTLAANLNISPDLGADAFDANQILGMVSGLFTFFIFSLIFLLSYLGGYIGIVKIGTSQIAGKRITLGETFRTIFSKTYWHVIAQYILFFLAEAGVVFAGVLLLMIFKFIGITTFIGVILLLAAICFAIYLTIKWYFIVIDLINTDGKIMESFSRSFHLVDNYWWRTLGIIFLISIIVNFAVSIVSTPLSFALSWNYFSHIFSMMAQGSDGKMDSAQSLEFLKAFSHSIGIIVIINLLMQSLAIPMFHIVIYFDLKIRHNDFVNPAETGENIAAI